MPAAVLESTQQATSDNSWKASNFNLVSSVKSTTINKNELGRASLPPSAMPKLHSHKVRLVGVDGQEQPVLFDIESEGVHLFSKKAEVSGL